MLITWGFVGGISVFLVFNVMFKSDGNKTRSGIDKASKISMKEFILAILEDNPNNERTIGFSDKDIVEIYETSKEIQALTEEKKTSLSYII